jgi:hypothetical protein
VKLVKTTTLVFAEGRSEKVYAVDLCEVGAGQFVVNFRHGKRGAPLKDGSKTAMPVERAEAERIFDKLVQRQVEKGYAPEGAPRAAAMAAPLPVTSGRGASRKASGELANEAQKARILERLAQTGSNRRWFKREGHDKTWNLERAIWRAGELRIAEAEPHLLRLIGTAPVSGEPAAGGRGLRDYCIAWALGRMGSEVSIEPLTKLYRDPSAPGHVTRIATLALVALGDAATKKAFAEHMISVLPEPLRASAGGTDPEAFARALRAHVAARPDAWGAVDIAYVIDTETVRPAILAELADVPLAVPYFYFVRHVFKAAEYRRDGRVFGILAHRIEKTRACFAHENRSYGRYARGQQVAYGGHTRSYLRHRIWRTLRRAGRDGDLDYVQLAVGVLLAFTDADAAPLVDVTRYDAWGGYVAFNHILFEHAASFTPSGGRNTWRVRRGSSAVPPAHVRTEAFPKLWEARPEGLMHLLAESDCTPVHVFAARAIAAAPAFLAQLDVDDVLTLLAKRFDVTARLGLELAEKRHDPNAPNMTLLLGMARSPYVPARQRAVQWLDELRPRVVADTALLAALTVARHEDVRAFARRLLRSTVLAPDAAAALVARIVATMLALVPPGDDACARDATQTLLLALASHLGSIGDGPTQDLLAHPLAGVQELGAELLLRRASGPNAAAIPDDVMVQILHSEHDSVRAVGLRILAELSDATLARMELLLVRLSIDKNADLRSASRPIIARVAAAFPLAGETIARALVESLLRRKLPDGVPAHVARMLRDELIGFAALLDREEIWRLLRSGSPHAQELGGLLLQRTDWSAVELPRVVELASHEILAVRRAAWIFYEQNEPRVRASMAEASRILDAKWDDSRAFAFDYFRTRLGQDAFSADVLVTILDSVRPDVQAFGRELAQKHFRDDDGPVLMTRLAEHPTVAVQTFTTNYLSRYAADRPGRLEAMVPYFTSVLSRVNQGRVAKQRVLAFLEAEGAKNAEAARVVVAILHRISATISVESRGATIAAMVAIHHAQPDVELPLRIKAPAKRGPGGVPVLV